MRRARTMGEPGLKLEPCPCLSPALEGEMTIKKAAQSKRLE
jgi:hypothetical protein